MVIRSGTGIEHECIPVHFGIAIVFLWVSLCVPSFYPFLIGFFGSVYFTVSPAYAQLVEDSGSGLAHLVYGGIYGLRFKPLAVDEPWSLDSPHQWGETHLSLATDRDLRYAP